MNTAKMMLSVTRIMENELCGINCTGNNATVIGDIQNLLALLESALEKLAEEQERGEQNG